MNVVREAQQRFGFPLPTLLVRLWSEVANGGIGPGYGIYGLEDGLTDEVVDLLGSSYSAKSQRRGLFQFAIGAAALARYSIARLPEGNMILITDKGERIDQGASFARWIEDWLNGIEVGADEYSALKNR